MENIGTHTMVIPYGLVGINFRYDSHILAAVRAWITENKKPPNVPHNGFEYHIYYTGKMTLDDFDDGDFEHE
jgi:hypothetical protein